MKINNHRGQILLHLNAQKVIIWKENIIMIIYSTFDPCADKLFVSIFRSLKAGIADAISSFK